MLAEKMKEQLKVRSAIRMAFEEGKRLETIYGSENVFDYSIGNPEIEPPVEVKESILRLMEENPLSLHAYMCDAGYEEVRSKIAAHLNRKHGTAFAERNIIMSNGAAGAMNVLMYSLMDPGDEVIVMKPYYPGYANFITNWNGKMVEVEPDPVTFYPDFDDFEKKITEKTKIVIVNSPNNPTGVIYSEKTVQKIAEILVKKQKEYKHAICLLADEPYRELVYTGAEVPYWTKYYENTAVAYSFSKTLSVPGERIGYLVIPDEMENSETLRKAVRNATGMLGFVNAPSLFQKVVGECLDAKTDIAAYKRNRDILYNKLVDLGFSVIEPEGAFYIFMKAPEGDEERLLNAAHDCNILLVGGSAFGYSGYARISFCVSSDKIKRSIPAFEKLAVKLELQGGSKVEN
jgi:aspartate aminotransferase